MVSVIWLIPLGVLGLLVSLYIVYKKSKKEHLVCVIGKKCDVVLYSEYNKVFNIPNEILGIIYYGSVILLSILILLGIQALGPLTFLLILVITEIGSFAFSAYLIYIQAAVLKAWCDYCVASAIISTLILIVELIII